MNWQPIETAPRDGTWILGCNDRGNQAVIIWSERGLDSIAERGGSGLAGFSHSVKADCPRSGMACASSTGNRFRRRRALT